MGFFGTIPDKAGRTGAAGSFVPAEPVAVVPVHHVVPDMRERRTQAVHRLQVGLFGLAGMLLLVSLANVIMDRAQQVEQNEATPTASASTTPANDPLVDMGVAPELPVDAAHSADKPAKPGQDH